MKLTSLMSEFFAGSVLASLVWICPGCATAPRSTPVIGNYSVAPLGPAMFRIKPEGGPAIAVAPDRGLDMALLRACQLPDEEFLREKGFTHFVVIDEDASTTGQTVYCAGLNNYQFKPARGIVVKYFGHRPKRMFSFDHRKLAKVLSEKLTAGG